MKLNIIFICLVGLLGTGMFHSCYYDNKDDLYDVIVIPGSGDCNFTDISYDTDLKPILDLYCNGACHNATDRQGNVILETYNQVKQYVDDGSLLGSVKYESGYAAMPPGAKLNSCDIEKLQFWVDQGALNN